MYNAVHSALEPGLAGPTGPGIGIVALTLRPWPYVTTGAAVGTELPSELDKSLRQDVFEERPAISGS